MIRLSLLCSIVCLLSWVVASVLERSVPLRHVHHDNQAMEQFLKLVNTTYPDITYLYSIGKSGKGQDLWVMTIGNNIHSYVELRPSVKYIGNMHGNEVVSREVLLHLIKYFVEGYSTNSTITNYLNTTVVHIMPSMNPDGYDNSTEGVCRGIIGRNNIQGIDLNRNFPDPWHNASEKPIAIETHAVMKWIREYNFVLSANLHGGTKVANYPFDQYYDSTKNEMAFKGHRNIGPSICPDDDTFKFLALTYSKSHQTMAIMNGTECGDYFIDGITNGADWYPVSGGMQDYNYLIHGIFELTLEISCCKFPETSELEYFWLENKDALVNLLMEAHRGVKGIIKDENNNRIEGAQLVIEGRELVPFQSRLHGEYHRILMPGSYTLLVKYKDYTPVSKMFEVQEGEVTHLDIILEKGVTDGASFVAGWSYLPFIVVIFVWF